jgi:hypothetical protein
MRPSILALLSIGFGSSVVTVRGAPQGGAGAPDLECGKDVLATYTFQQFPQAFLDKINFEIEADCNLVLQTSSTVCWPSLQAGDPFVDTYPSSV